MRVMRSWTFTVAVAVTPSAVAVIVAVPEFLGVQTIKLESQVPPQMLPEVETFAMLGSLVE